MNTLERINDVEDPLAPKGTRSQQLKRYFDQEVTESWADLIVLLSCFVTGLLDSAVFNVWSCFVSMQTGNTIYSGLGMFGQPKSQPFRWVKSLNSIFFFIFGSYFWSRVMRYMGSLKRSTVVFVFLFQALLIFISAALVKTGTVPNDAGDLLPDDYSVLVPISLLAFGQAAQIVMSRVLGYGEVTSVVITSAYCDLFFDPDVLTKPLKENVKRNRRVASAVLLFLGAALGGFLTQHGDIATALWCAGSLKTFIAFVWLFWKGKGGIRLD